MTKETRITLYSSLVGSRGWKMQQSDSDWDYWDIYQAPSKHIKGKESHGFFKNHIPWNRTSFEIGYHINEIIAGNINHIICPFSPSICNSDPLNIINDNDIKKSLQKIVKRNPSKNIFHSINGIARHNLDKYFNIHSIDYIPNTSENLNQRLKKIAQILRLVLFGHRVLTKKEYTLVSYQINRETCNLYQVDRWRNELKKDYNTTHLPEKPDKEPFNNFLLALRMDYLKKNFNQPKMNVTPTPERLSDLGTDIP